MSFGLLKPKAHSQNQPFVLGLLRPAGISGPRAAPKTGERAARLAVFASACGRPNENRGAPGLPARENSRAR
jgi:hypothetical protein